MKYLTPTLLAIVAIGVSIVFGRLARKTSHVWRWGLTACLLVSAATALIVFQFQFSDAFGENAVIFGLRPGMKQVPLLDWGQFFVPLAAGLLALRRSAENLRRATKAEGSVSTATG